MSRFSTHSQLEPPVTVPPAEGGLGVSFCNHHRMKNHVQRFCFFEWLGGKRIT